MYGMNRTERTAAQLTQWITVLLIAVARAKAEETSVPPKRIVVSLADRSLALFEGDRLVKSYDVAVGKPATPSPQGQFVVARRVANPTWYGPDKIVGPGKKNPVGTRWIGLNLKGYGIHGTSVPSSIGKAASHGCIRMRNADVEELFELIDVGVPVELSTAPAAWLTPPAATLMASVGYAQ
jgi:lipoprotein-anchoring transpeptidase ErfK/SrfK